MVSTKRSRTTARIMNPKLTCALENPTLVAIWTRFACTVWKPPGLISSDPDVLLDFPRCCTGVQWEGKQEETPGNSIQAQIWTWDGQQSNSVSCSFPRILPLSCHTLRFPLDGLRKLWQEVEAAHVASLGIRTLTVRRKGWSEWVTPSQGHGPCRAFLSLITSLQAGLSVMRNAEKAT